MNTELETEKPKDGTVDQIKQATEIAGTFQGAIKAITSIASSDAVTNIIKIVAMLFMGIGWFLLKRRITNVLIKRAKELSEHEKQELRDYLASIQERTDDSVVTDLEQGF